MKSKGLLIVAAIVVIIFLFIKKKVTSAATSIPMQADSATPKQNTVLQFPVSDLVQSLINTTVPDTYKAPDLPPPIGIGDTIQYF